MKKLCVLTLVVVLTLVLAVAASAAGTRLKEIAALEGVRDNQLIGYGVVVGLAGTGDKVQTVFSTQELGNILKRMGVTIDPTAILVHNMAAAMVTASLPAFAQPGTTIDVTAGAIGDATNLQGGLLLLTPLRGADGQVYAVAQGALVTGGFIAGRGGNTTIVNHPTVGRTPAGAIVERTPPTVALSSRLKLQLRQADFTTAARVTDALNKHFGLGGLAVARAESSAVVVVDLPAAYASRPVEFVSEMEGLIVDTDHRTKIVINERTGTIVMGKDVEISPVAIMHGAMAVEVRTVLEVSQPAPQSAGKTTVVPQVTVDVKDDKAKKVILQKGATVEDLVRALQGIGSTPRDVLAILQSMSAAGALEAEIEVI